MKSLNDLKIGEWTPVEDGTFCIRLNKESFFSSKNQDTIMIMEMMIRIEKKIDKALKN